MTDFQGKGNPFHQLTNADPALAAQYASIWEKAITYLTEKVSSVTVNTWLCNIFPVKFENNKAVLFILNDFQREIVISRYLPLVEEGIAFALNKTAASVSFIGPNDPFTLPVQQNLSPEKKEDHDYEYTFDTFIVGSSNRFAHAACMNVATTPARSYNPLFIYGGSGLGKTHLLYAIMNQIRQSFPQFKIVYLKGDDFTNEVISAIHHGTTAELREKYRNADLLLMDDIQFIGGKEATQEEFFHTFNSLYESKKQIVLTSDRPPKEIATLDDRLRTRFEWGLIADIQSPDFETRAAIIKRKADIIGISLSDDIVALISNSVKTNIRQLEGAVKKLKAYNQLTGSNINLEITRDAIKDILTSEFSTVISPEKIISEVASFYNITPSDMIGRKKTNKIAMPRQVAMYITRCLTDLSLPSIGEAFGGRDHTTIMYAFSKIEGDMGQNILLKQTIEDLMKNLKENN